MNSFSIQIKFFLVLQVILFSKCISLERGIQSTLYFSASNIAAYKLENSPVLFSNSDESDLIQLETNLIRKILFTIKKEKGFLKPLGIETFWNQSTREELIPVIQKISDNANKGITFFVVIKEEDKLSPYSRIFRSTVYINRDGNLLQFIFGEIKSNINFGTQFSFQDWANPSFFKVSCEKNKILFFEGKLENAFQFKNDLSCADTSNSPVKSFDSKTTNRNNYRWIQVDLGKIVNLDLKQNPIPPKEIQQTRESRLQELKNLYKKGLINKEDYELKKTEILGEL